MRERKRGDDCASKLPFSVWAGLVLMGVVRKETGEILRG